MIIELWADVIAIGADVITPNVIFDYLLADVIAK